jgi:transposase
VISGENGFPVRCGAIHGSKNDTLTMEDLLAALKAWGYRGMPMIVDRGMLSAQNIKIARKESFNIIGCCPETSNEVASALSYWTDEDISKWENAVKRYSEGMVYVKGWKRALYEQSGSIVVVLDPARKAMEKANRDMMIKELSETTDKKRVKELKGVLSSVIVKFRLKKAGIDMSVDKAVDELKNLTFVEFSYKGKVRWKLSRATKKQLLLMKAIDADKLLHSAT